MGYAGESMQSNQLKIVLAVILMSQGVQARINFGNKKSGFVVTDSTTLIVDASQSLSTGMVRDNGGTIVLDAVSCNDLKLERVDNGIVNSFALYGSISQGTVDEGIYLNDDDLLVVDNETIEVPIFAESGVSTLRGRGFFDADIRVLPGSILNLDWQGVLNTNIRLEAAESGAVAVLSLENDLYLGNGWRIIPGGLGDYENRINFNGYRLFIGGDESPVVLPGLLHLSNANIHLRGTIETQENVLVLHDGPSYVHGGGHVYIVNEYGIFANEAEILDGEGFGTDEYYPVTFEDITFRNVWCGFFQGGNYWNLINTTCESGVRALTINGMLVGNAPSPLFGNTSFERANLVVHTDFMESEGTWTFLEDSSIDYEGNTVDASLWHIVVEEGVNLVIRNAVFTGVDADSFSGTGTIYFSHVTFEIGDADIDWSSGPTFMMQGPATFFTGPAIVTVPTGSAIHNTTVLYDTSGGGDLENIVGFDESEGRVKYVDADTTTSVNLTLDGIVLSDQDERLYPRITGAPFRIMTFVQGESSIAYNGGGHRIILPFITDDLLELGGAHAVIFVGDGENQTLVTMENVTIEGFKSDFFSYNINDSQIYFGNNTILTLQENLVSDTALSRNLIFGTGTSGRAESMCLDLQGHTLDCDENEIIVQGDSLAAHLRIKNGRILNPLFSHDDTKIVLENVELVLSDDTSFAGAAIDIEGQCRITGSSDRIFRWLSDGNFTLKSGSTLTLMDGITFFHDNAGIDNFVFEDSTATLELMGAQFKRKVFESSELPLVLKKGRLVIDHTASIDVGDQSIQIGIGDSDEDLLVEIRPDATLTVRGTGSLIYDNVY
jgi:hypothetical protein